MSILKVDKLTKTYGDATDSNCTHALNGVSLVVQQGEFISIMGPSGSGKTTLLNIIGGLDQPTTGLIEVSGTSIQGLSKEELSLYRSQKIGFVFQDFNLLESLSIKENILLPLILINAQIDTQMEEKAHKLMEYLEIADIRDKYPNIISGGQQQRAVIARALIKDPVILLADEPTGNLDSASAKKTMGIFRKINHELQSTVLMVTHDPLAASYSDRVIFIKDGREYAELIAKADRKEFFNSILSHLAVLEGENHAI